MKEEAYILITKWIQLNQEIKEINKYLFDHTELFEEKYCVDFNEDLFRFFAGKLNRYARDYNQLINKLSPEQRQKLHYYKLIKRY